MFRLNLAAALCIAALTTGCAKETAPTAAPPLAPTAVQAPAAAAPIATTANFVQVASSEVCMMNNHHMAKPQIPVVVEGRTYFGCCEMCKAKLANDPSARTAMDPVSQKPVDKSVAVIGKKASGEVVYFESQANLNEYAKRM